MDRLVIGYGVVDKNVETFAGGVMITDISGLPIEFRYTEPLTPTRIQRVLYGDVLEGYIKGEVIIKSLYDSLENQPDLLIVNEETLLEMPEMKIPVISASMTRMKPLSEAGASQKMGEREYLVQVNDTGSPVRIKLITAGNDEIDHIKGLLVSAAATMDLTEPLVRVAEALEMLCSKEREK